MPPAVPRAPGAAEVAQSVIATRKIGGGWQLQILWSSGEKTWEAASRVRREVPQLVQEFEQQQAQQPQGAAQQPQVAAQLPQVAAQQPQMAAQQAAGAAEGATDSNEAVVLQEAVAAQPGSGAVAAADTAALQRQVEELALLVKQQAQEFERQQQQHARQQQLLIEQLRASPAHSPRHSGPPLPQHPPQQHARLTAAAAAAVELQPAPPAAAQSRFARKEPRATDLQEYDGASGAKLDDWLKQLAMAARLYHLHAQEAVDFAGSRLRGAALDWWLALSADELAAIADREALGAALRARFQPVTAARTAREQLDKLQQGSRGVNEYIADFQRLATQIGMASLGQENALHAFERGLRRELAVELRKQGAATLQEAIALAARVGGLMQSSAAQPGRSSVHQMDIDDGDGAAAALDERITKAVLNAMQARDSSSSTGARTQSHRGYMQERERNAGGAGRGGARGGGRGGRFAPRGPPPVPGVSEHEVQRRWDAKQCLRCGQGGHISPACPNAISASGN
jgi:hypothetical protein